MESETTTNASQVRAMTPYAQAELLTAHGWTRQGAPRGIKTWHPPDEPWRGFRSTPVAVRYLLDTQPRP